MDLDAPKIGGSCFSYGMPWFTKDDIKRLYGADSKVDYKVTSISAHPDKDQLLERIGIDIYDYVVTSEMERNELFLG